MGETESAMRRGTSRREVLAQQTPFLFSFIASTANTQPRNMATTCVLLYFISQHMLFNIYLHTDV